MATVAPVVTTATVVTPTPPAAAATLQWINTTHDFTAEAADDWTGESADTVGSADVVITNGGNNSALGPDGTGCVFRTDGVQAWNATSRNTGCLSMLLTEVIPGVSDGDIIGVCADFVTPVDHSTAQDAYVLMIEQDPTDAAAEGVRIRARGNGDVDSQAITGGVATNDTVAEGSTVRRMLMIVDTRTGYTACYYSTSAGGSAPTWDDLSSWTRNDAAEQTRLRVDAGGFDAETDYATVAAASDCGITLTHLHGARLGAA